MSDSEKPAGRPSYDEFTNYESSRSAGARSFARQILQTTGPWLAAPLSELDVLDVGSGYGHTALELAGTCRSVVGLEPAPDLHQSARLLGADTPNLEFHQGAAETMTYAERFDLVILDNVYEHLPDQEGALRQVCAALRPGGVFYLLVPNRLWPIEAHYRLPFLSWLPLPAANRYLRLSGRGTDYTDASYAPTLHSLRRSLDAHPELDWSLTLPGDTSTIGPGAPLHYRVGARALARVPSLWTISKSLLVVGRRTR